MSSTLSAKVAHFVLAGVNLLGSQLSPPSHMVFIHSSFPSLVKDIASAAKWNTINQKTLTLAKLKWKRHRNSGCKIAYKREEKRVLRLGGEQCWKFDVGLDLVWRLAKHTEFVSQLQSSLLRLKLIFTICSTTIHVRHTSASTRRGIYGQICPARSHRPPVKHLTEHVASIV